MPFLLPQKNSIKALKAQVSVNGFQFQRDMQCF